MRVPPLSILSSWPAPNYSDPETRGPATIVVLVVLLGIATIVLGIRIYARCRISNGFGLDDILIISAYVWNPIDWHQHQLTEIFIRYQLQLLQ